MEWSIKKGVSVDFGRRERQRDAVVISENCGSFKMLELKKITNLFSEKFFFNIKNQK